MQSLSPEAGNQASVGASRDGGAGNEGRAEQAAPVDGVPIQSGQSGETTMKQRAPRRAPKKLADDLMITPLQIDPEMDIEPTAEEIASRAWQIWQREGCPEGRDREHWLMAEAELKDELVRAVGPS